MSKQKNTDNFFDDLDVWSDSPSTHKQTSFSEPSRRETDDLDEFFGDFTGNSGLRRAQPSRHRHSRGSGSKKLLPIILALVAALACICLAFVLIGNFMDNRKPEPGISSGPVATKPQVQIQTEPQPAPTLPAPVLSPPAPAETAPPTVPAPVPQTDFRYFGKRLNAEQQQLYAIIQDGIAQRSDEIGPLQISHVDALKPIVTAVFYDYPEYFWFHGGYSGSYYNHDTYLEYTLSPMYDYTAQECVAYTAFVESAAQPIVNQLAGKSDYEKVKGVYEYLVDNTIYDLDYTGTSIYEMFYDRRGVCEGYARATQYLLTKLGVETLYVTGLGGEYEEPKSKWEPHAWNIVKIDGIYYQIDTTWGDPLHDDGSQTKSFNYLNLTDEEMARRHERDNWAHYPPCTDIRYNYYIYEGNYLDTFSKETITYWFQEAYAKGEALEFKCANDDIYQQSYSWLVDNQGFSELFKTVLSPGTEYKYLYSCSDDLYILNVIQD